GLLGHRPRGTGDARMTTYVFRRILQTIPTLLVASLLVWLLVYALPGDPAIVVAGDNATPETVAFERERLGLNEPMAVQYITWLGNILQGDFGHSYMSNADVGSLIIGRL